MVLANHTVDEAGEVVHNKGKSFNGNVSVLDPVACEVILRFFMPLDGKRVYNPFGGGVQFGFVTGDNGYEYLSSGSGKISAMRTMPFARTSQNVKWHKSDSSKFTPEGKGGPCVHMSTVLPS